MGTCPFCHADIDEHLIRLGGKCPHCFAWIPGEEAPTDPGAQVRQQQERADRRAAGTSRWLPALLVVTLLLGVVVVAVGVTLHQPKPVAAILDFDDLAGYPEIDLVALPPEPVAEPEAVAARPRPRPRPTPKPDGGGPDITKVDFDPSVASADDVRRVQVGDGTGSPDLLGGPSVAGAAGGEAPSFDLGGIGVKRAPPRLTTDEAIIGHIYAVMKDGAPRIRKCYDLRIKATTDVAGTWQIDYTVGREGDVQGVRVTGLDMSDPELESCLTREVEAWKFYPIRADQPVTKRFTFRPGFG